MVSQCELKWFANIALQVLPRFVFTADQCGIDILGEQNSDDAVVIAAIDDWKTRMRFVLDPLQVGIAACCNIQHIGIVAGDHHAADVALIEFEQIMQHGRLVVFDFTVFLGGRHQSLKLVATEDIRVP